MADAYEQEIIALIPRLRAFTQHLCGNRAEGEDLAQETVLRALSNRHRFEEGSNLRAWIYTIARNAFFSDRRRKGSQAVPLDQTMLEETRRAVDDPLASMELNDLRRALGLLPAEQREAIILVGAGGCSYEEAAEIAGVALGTIKSRVNRARVKLEAMLDDGVRLPRDRASAVDAADLIIQEMHEARTGA